MEPFRRHPAAFREPTGHTGDRGIRMPEELCALDVDGHPSNVREVIDASKVVNSLLRQVVMDAVVLGRNTIRGPREVGDELSPARMRERLVEIGFRNPRIQHHESEQSLRS